MGPLGRVLVSSSIPNQNQVEKSVRPAIGYLHGSKKPGSLTELQINASSSDSKAQRRKVATRGTVWKRGGPAKDDKKKLTNGRREHQLGPAGGRRSCLIRKEGRW